MGEQKRKVYRSEHSITIVGGKLFMEEYPVTPTEKWCNFYDEESGELVLKLVAMSNQPTMEIIISAQNRPEIQPYLS